MEMEGTLRTNIRLRRLALLAAVAAVLYLCTFDAWKINAHWFHSGTSLAVSGQPYVQDLDQTLFIREVKSFPTLSSTLRLWTRCVPPDTNWWRPLLMWGFWAEYQCFGESNNAGYFGCLIASHILFLTVFALTLQRITGSWAVALLALLLFSADRACLPMSLANGLLLGNPLWSAAPGGNVALYFWKDQNEMWSGTCFLLAFLACLRGRWLLGIAAFACAAMLKESGWLVAVLVLFVLAIDRRLRDVPWKAWLAFGVVVILLLLGRAHVGFDPTHGRNFEDLPAAGFRYFRLVGGRGLLALTGVSWPAAAVGVGLGLVLALGALRRISTRIGLVVWAVFSAAMIAFWAEQQGRAFSIVLVSMLTPECDLPLFVWEAAYAFAATAVLCDRGAWRSLAILIAGSFIAGLPTIANPRESEHIAYFTNAFQAAIVAFVWVWMARLGWQALRRKWVSPRTVVPEAVRTNSPICGSPSSETEDYCGPGSY
jgi:hypothetical protein